MFKFSGLVAILLFTSSSFSQQLATARDTISVIQNGKVLKMPWANGLNYCNVSNIDLNHDGIKDLVFYDRVNHINTGRFRCFLKTGPIGSATYSFAPELSYLFPTVYNWAVFYDYNCDGKEDLFCSTNSGIKVYRNAGSANQAVNFVLVTNLLLSNYSPGSTPFYANIYVSSVGVPGISDIDNDGDLDILTFSSQGVFIEYHQNLSMELYNNCDSLKFEYKDYCWGKFSESSCGISLNQCLPTPPKQLKDFITNSKEYHAGSCLTCIDSDGDGDKDLIMGDISCDRVHYAHNTGDSNFALITDTTLLYPNFPAKNNTSGIKLNSFPCAYHVDVDGDGVKDLIASPSAFGSENYKSCWYYKNTSLTSTVNFQFVKNNFLQDEMIEVGQNAFPLVMDVDSDGKLDLLIGTYGFYEGNTLKSRLSYYRNIGSLSQPSYSFITNDFDSLSKHSIFHMMPTSGDIDGDGDMDLLVGNSSGQIHWLENTAGAGNPCHFSVFKNNPFGFTTISAEAAPQLFDIDEDGKLDLLIGMKNGRVSYYRNTGSLSSPAYSLITNTFGDIDVKGSITIFGIDGYAVPYFFKESTGIKVLVGSISGNVFYYTVPTTISQACNLVNANVNNYNEGAQSAPHFVDVNNDGKRDLFLGNAGGGLSFFSSASPFVNLEELNSEQMEHKIVLFPNPSNGALTIKILELEVQEAEVTVSDLYGRKLMTQTLPNNEISLNLNALHSGVYSITLLIQTNSTSRQVTKKWIKVD